MKGHLAIANRSVKTIKEWAFYNCTGSTTVTLGDGLEEIGRSAFFNECVGLERVVIHNTVKT